LLDYQRQYGDKNGAVLDGRDIGTIVFPHADIKLFVTASLDARAERRHTELLRRGERISLEAVKIDLKLRDEADRNRAAAPLIPAQDATQFDTTHMDADTALGQALELIRNRTR
jgi:cytidylate kinase